jgi:hypothetical protein
MCTFDGKIGMWPFIKQVEAQRDSVNRPAGTIETKCVTVTKAVYREFMIEKVIPAIKEKWPNQQELRDGLIIQQDVQRPTIETRIRLGLLQHEMMTGLVGVVSPFTLNLQTLLTPTYVIFLSSELCSPTNGTTGLRQLLTG